MNNKRVFTELNCAKRTNNEFINWIDKNYQLRSTTLTQIKILLNPKRIRDESLRNYARSLLIHFVQTFTNIYNESFITHNFHGIIHLVDDADYFSKIIINNQFNLEYISAFQFENYLQKLKTMVRGKIDL